MSSLSRTSCMNLRWRGRSVLSSVCGFSLLVATNGAWLWRESQWETVETWQDVWQEADGNGNNQFVGGDYNGWPESENTDADANP